MLIKTLLSATNPNSPTKDKLCDFVEKYWHFDNISKNDEKHFIHDYSGWANEKGYHQSENKARKIYELAQSGIPTLFSDTPSTKMLILEAVRVLREINRTLEKILTQMHNLMCSLPEHKVMQSMPGVGAVLAPRIIGEIGDIKNIIAGVF